MLSVQAIHLGGDERTTTTITSSSERILENSGGVAHIRRANAIAATCVGVTALNRQDEEAEYTRWDVRSLTWSHACGLLLFQGASIQQLLSPYLILRFTARKIYNPTPGLDDVLLVEILRGPDLKGLEQLAFYRRREGL